MIAEQNRPPATTVAMSRDQNQADRVADQIRSTFVGPRWIQETEKNRRAEPRPSGRPAAAHGPKDRGGSTFGPLYLVSRASGEPTRPDAADAARPENSFPRRHCREDHRGIA